MGWIVGTILMFIVLLASVVVGENASKARTEEQPIRRRGGYEDETKVVVKGGQVKLGAYVLAGLMAFGILALTFASSLNIVDAGHVGVVKTFGAIDGQVDDGPAFVAPWSEVITVSTKAQRKEFEHLAAFSKETQDVFVDATLNLAVAPGEIQCLYRTVGSDWYEKLIPPRVLQTLKDETVKYTTVDVAPAREEIRRNVRARLQTQLKEFKIREGACSVSIDVQDFLIRNIDFRPEFKQAIERKQIATQDAQTAKNKVEQAKQEANQAIATAEGQRQVKVKNAQGEAQATLITATAQAEANKKLARSLTSELISFTYVQKLAPSVHTIVTADGKVAVPPGALAPQSGK